MSSGGKSSSKSRSRQFVDPTQVPFLNQLRTDAQQLAATQGQSIGSVADQLSGRLGGIGDQLLGGLAEQSGLFGPGVAQSQELLGASHQVRGSLASSNCSHQVRRLRASSTCSMRTCSATWHPLSARLAVRPLCKGRLVVIVRLFSHSRQRVRRNVRSLAGRRSSWGKTSLRGVNCLVRWQGSS